MAERRTSYEIYWEILVYCRTPRTFTAIIGRCDLNSKTGQEHLRFLVDRSLPRDGKGWRTVTVCGDRTGRGVYCTLRAGCTRDSSMLFRGSGSELAAGSESGKGEEIYQPLVCDSVRFVPARHSGFSNAFAIRSKSFRWISSMPKRKAPPHDFLFRMNSRSLISGSIFTSPLFV